MKMNHNEIIKKLFFRKRIRRSIWDKFRLNMNLYPNIKNYLLNISNDIDESLYRIFKNDFSIRTCKFCHKEIDYFSTINFCSNECRRKSQIYQTKQSNFKKYGVENVAQLQTTQLKMKKTRLKNNVKCGTKNEKYKSTCLQKYGVENPAKCKSIIEKTFKTKKLKYGYENSFQNEKILKKAIKSNKLEKTKEKRKNTVLNKYGVDNIFKVTSLFNYAKQIEKGFETKRKNNTFKTSQSEEKTYKLLKEKYPDVIRQYKSDVYPFACDFYIPSLDLYIECNYHWTHGRKPYEANEKDNVIVEGWKEKGTKYYMNAINTWTNLDVRKRTIAKENKLNYLEFFTFDMFKNWL